MSKSGLIACLLYWKYGAASPYYVSAIFMVLPIFMVLALDAPVDQLSAVKA